MKSISTRTQRILVSLFFQLTIASSFSLGRAAQECRDIFQGESLLPATLAQNKLLGEKSKDLTDSHRPILALVKTWQDRLATAQRNENKSEYFNIQSEISDFAASLIQTHQNLELFFLASQISFPLNKTPYEDHNGFFYYGSSLLEVTILAKNYLVYRKLRTIARDYRWPQDKDVHVQSE